MSARHYTEFEMATFHLCPLPDVPFVSNSFVLREAYEESRRRHRILHPIIEHTGDFVITPELEQERADRIDNQWK